MKEVGIQVKRKKKYKVISGSIHKLPVFENLLERDFSQAQPDQVYSSDVFYIWTQECWLYLAVMIDLFTRKIVDWNMSHV